MKRARKREPLLRRREARNIAEINECQLYPRPTVDFDRSQSQKCSRRKSAPNKTDRSMPPIAALKYSRGRGIVP